MFLPETHDQVCAMDLLYTDPDHLGPRWDHRALHAPRQSSDMTDTEDGGSMCQRLGTEVIYNSHPGTE